MYGDWGGGSVEDRTLSKTGGLVFFLLWQRKETLRKDSYRGMYSCELIPLWNRLGYPTLAGHVVFKADWVKPRIIYNSGVSCPPAVSL